MSYLPQKQAGFYEAVQVYFTEVTGRMALFGARDRALLDQWNERGMPAQVVCRGIRDAVTQDSDGAPRSLVQCEMFVDRRWEKIQKRRVGSHESGGGESDETTASGGESSDGKEKSTGGGGGLFEAVHRALKRAEEDVDQPRWCSAYRQGQSALEKVGQDDSPLTIDDIEAIDRALVEAYLAALKEEERRAIEESIAEESTEIVRTMSPSAKREHLWMRRKRTIVERFGLVDVLDVITG